MISYDCQKNEEYRLRQIIWRTFIRYDVIVGVRKAISVQQHKKVKIVG